MARVRVGGPLSIDEEFAPSGDDRLLMQLAMQSGDRPLSGAYEGDSGGGMAGPYTGRSSPMMSGASIDDSGRARDAATARVLGGSLRGGGGMSKINEDSLLASDALDVYQGGVFDREPQTEEEALAAGYKSYPNELKTRKNPGRAAGQQVASGADMLLDEGADEEALDRNIAHSEEEIAAADEVDEETDAAATAAYGDDESFDAELEGMETGEQEIAALDSKYSEAENDPNYWMDATGGTPVEEEMLAQGSGSSEDAGVIDVPAGVLASSPGVVWEENGQFFFSPTHGPDAGTVFPVSQGTEAGGGRISGPALARDGDMENQAIDVPAGFPFDSAESIDMPPGFPFDNPEGGAPGNSVYPDPDGSAARRRLLGIQK